MEDIQGELGATDLTQENAIIPNLKHGALLQHREGLRCRQS